MMFSSSGALAAAQRAVGVLLFGAAGEDAECGTCGSLALADQAAVDLVQFGDLAAQCHQRRPFFTELRLANRFDQFRAVVEAGGEPRRLLQAITGVDAVLQLFQ